jgi:hypothetical protein
LTGFKCVKKRRELLRKKGLEKRKEMSGFLIFFQQIFCRFQENHCT